MQYSVATDLHGVAVGCLQFDGLFAGGVELRVLSRLHGRLQAAHKGTTLDGLVGKVLELVENDLTMDHNEALNRSDLQQNRRLSHVLLLLARACTCT